MKMLMLCGALVAIAAPAAAGGVHPVDGNPEVLQITVPSADLDLTRQAGADVMIARIRRAAGSVCGGDKPLAWIRMAQQTRACIGETMTKAVRQLDAPLVTARFVNKAPPGELAARLAAADVHAMAAGQ
jgi:UrcA family protein